MNFISMYNFLKEKKTCYFMTRYTIKSSEMTHPVVMTHLKWCCLAI